LEVAPRVVAAATLQQQHPHAPGGRAAAVARGGAAASLSSSSASSASSASSTMDTSNMVMQPFTLAFKSPEVEGEFLGEVAKKRWPVLMFIFCFDVLCFGFRFTAKLSATTGGPDGACARRRGAGRGKESSGVCGRACAHVFGRRGQAAVHLGVGCRCLRRCTSL
jgi:hypothetical protein